MPTVPFPENRMRAADGCHLTSRIRARAQPRIGAYRHLDSLCSFAETTDTRHVGVVCVFHHESTVSVCTHCAPHREFPRFPSARSYDIDFDTLKNIDRNSQHYSGVPFSWCSYAQSALGTHSSVWRRPPGSTSPVFEMPGPCFGWHRKGKRPHILQTLGRRILSRTWRKLIEETHDNGTDCVHGRFRKHLPKQRTSMSFVR